MRRALIVGVCAGLAIGSLLGPAEATDRRSRIDPRRYSNPPLDNIYYGSR